MKASKLSHMLFVVFFVLLMISILVGALEAGR